MRLSNKILYLVLLLFVSVNIFSFSMFKKVRLKCNSFTLVKSGVYAARGKVRIYWKDLVLFSKKAYFYSKKEAFEAEGNVFVKDPRFLLWCKKVQTGSSTHEIIATGKVKIETDSLIIYANKAIYNRDKEIVKLPDFPRIYEKNPQGKKKPNFTTAKDVVYYVRTDTAKLVSQVLAKVYGDDNVLTTIRTDLLYANPDQTFDAFGNISIEREDKVALADKGTFIASKEIAVLYGKVIVKAPDYMLYAGYLRTFLKENRSYAQLEPRLIKKEKKDGKLRIIDLKADEIEIYSDENRVVGRGNVVLVEKEDNAKAVLTADLIEYYGNRKFSVSIGNVKIVKDNVTVYGDKLYYYEQKRRMEVEGNAKLERTVNGKTDTVWGKKIIYFEDQDRLIVQDAYSILNTSD